MLCRSFDPIGGLLFLVYEATFAVILQRCNVKREMMSSATYSCCVFSSFS